MSEIARIAAAIFRKAGDRKRLIVAVAGASPRRDACRSQKTQMPRRQHPPHGLDVAVAARISRRQRLRQHGGRAVAQPAVHRTPPRLDRVRSSRRGWSAAAGTGAAQPGAALVRHWGLARSAANARHRPHAVR